VAYIAEKRAAYRTSVCKPGGNGLGRTGCRWEDNIKMALQEVGWRDGTGLIRLRIWTSGRLLWAR
jgi:hypothetical protein